MSISNTELKAGLNVIIAVADAIKQSRRIPAGELYTVMMSYVDLCGFEKIVAILKRANLVEETITHELVWKEAA